MDSSRSYNKDSDDSIQLELSPMNSKGNGEADEPADSFGDTFKIGNLEESREEDNSGKERKVEGKNVSKIDKNLMERRDDGGKLTPKDNSTTTKNEETKNKMESSLLDTNNSSKYNVNSSKIAAPTVAETKEAKRKRTISSDQRNEISREEAEAQVKRAKIKNTNDNFCWRCHKESVDARCSACPRSWHKKCMGGAPPTSINENWICGECATILRAENAETRSEVVAHMSIDHLCMLLKYIVERMRSCQGSEPFWKAVDLNEVPNYMDYVVRPMDLNQLESNVRLKLYGSTDAFMADAKWIQHNCIVFNTCGGVYADTSKLTNAAKQIIKIAKQEVAEIEACPDCYARGRNLPRPHQSWFVEACRKPHPLIWAKLKGFPFWPAKAMPRVNGQGYVDVRFFGQHDRAWVAPKDVYLYSREPPTPLPRKRKVEMAECIKEITRHCRKLEIAFGPFEFAPPKTPYDPQDPLQIKIMLPHYDPLRPNENPTAAASAAPRRSPFRKRSTAIKRKHEADTTINENAVESRENNSPKKSNWQPVDSEKPDSMVNYTFKQNKRQKKMSVDGEAQSLRDEGTSSLIRTSQANYTRTGNDNPTKVNKTTIAATSNGTQQANVLVNESKINTREMKNNGPTIILKETKVKSDKTGFPLEKSLAGLLRSVNIKGRLSNPRNTNSKVAVSLNVASNSPRFESKGNSIKVYKPKARMVDKVNAEKALKCTREKDETSKESGESSKNVEAKLVNGLLTPVTLSGVSVGNSTTVAGGISLLPNKRDNNIMISNKILKVAPKKLQSRILLVNNGSIETKQVLVTSEDTRTRTEASAVRVKQEPNLSPQITATTQQKPSRAKKSFPNKPPRLPHLLPKLAKVPQPSMAKPLDTMVYIPTQGNDNGLNYELPPPEAGPLSAQIHRGANELAKRMGQLLEEAVKQAAESNVNEPGNSLDSRQATVHSLRLQIERMRWQHQQQIAEIKHNTDRTSREMRASLEAERLRAIEEIRKEADEERTRCIDETKTKQWCAHCSREALFYCCWNTAYCDHLCQQAHWLNHQQKCAQKASLCSSGSASGDTSNRQRSQVMPILVEGPRVNWCKSLESDPL